MSTQTRKPLRGKRFTAITAAVALALTGFGAYSFTPQAAAAEHNAADFTGDLETNGILWLKWDFPNGAETPPVTKPYAGPHYNEFVTITTSDNVNLTKFNKPWQFFTVAEKGAYGDLGSQLNDGTAKPQGTYITGANRRTVTFTFDKPVLNPYYRMDITLVSQPNAKHEMPFQTYSWEDIRLAAIDGNPVEPGTPIMDRVRHVRNWFASGYNHDVVKEDRLAQGALEVDPAKFFVQDANNPNNLRPAPKTFTTAGQRIQEVTGWVKELTFEMTPRAFVADNYNDARNRYVGLGKLSSALLNVGAPINDVGVKKTVTPTSVAQGDTLTWNVRVTNHQSQVTGVEGYYLIDELPENVDPATFKVVSKPEGAEQVKVDGRKVYLKKVAPGYELLLSDDENYAEVVGGNRAVTPSSILDNRNFEDYVFSAKILAKDTCASEKVLNKVRVVPAFYDSNKNNNKSEVAVTYKCVTPVNATSTAPQGEDQHSTDKETGDEGKSVAEMFPNIPANTTYALKGADEQGNVVIPGVGSYSIENGVVTFKPLPDYVGTAPAATIVATTPGKGVYEATYTPTVTDKVTPVNAETVGMQGEPQTSADKKAEAEVNGQVDAGKTKAEMFPNAAAGSKLSLKDADPVTGVKTVPGEGSYIINAEDVVVFTPEPDFTGTATPVTVVLTTPSQNAFEATYTATVLEKEITPVNVTTVGDQGQPQKASDKDDAADGGKTPAEMFPGAPKGSTYKLKDPKTQNPTEEVVVDGQGTYRIDPATGEVTFTPEPKFTGQATPVTVILTTPGKNMPEKGQETPKDYEATYTPTVLEAKLVAKPATTVGEQGQPQKSNDKVEAEGDKGLEPNEMFPNFPTGSTFKLQGANGEETSVEVDGVGTYEIDGATGIVTFTPEPKFTGVAPAADIVLTTPENVKYTAPYTPTVKEADLTGVDATTTGVQGEDQHSTDTGEGDKGLDPNAMFPNFPTGSTFTIEGADPNTGVKVVPGEGTYTVDPKTGVITFDPDPKFVGTATPVVVKITTPGGKTATANYTPTVTPGEIVPVAATTVGNQGEPQTSEDKNAAPAGSGPEVLKDAGKTPEEMFPNFPYGSTFKLKNAEGQEVEEVVIDKVGRYTIAETGVVTFSPDPQFVGEAPAATVVMTPSADVVTAGGKKVEATYTPTVLENPVSPKPAATTGVQGEKQNAADKDAGDNGLTPAEMFPNYPYNSTFALKDPKSGEKVTTVTIEGQGTYEINPTTGELTFTPVADFTGVATPANVVLTTPGKKDYETTYTPTVTEGVITPENATTTGAKGEPQTSADKDNADEGKTPAEMFPGAPRGSKLVLLDAKGKEANVVKVPNQGTYEINPEGVVTFTPLPEFSGPADPVTVQLTTPAGTKVTATYTPTVSELAGVPATTTGVQGQPQTSADNGDGDNGKTPEEMFPGLPAGSTFALEGAATEGDNLGKVVVEGQGVYSIDDKGVVTFTPEPKFTGDATPVTIKATTPNGATVTATYTPTVTEGDITPKPVESTGPQGAVQEWPGVDEAFPNAPTGSTLKLKDPTSGAPVDEVVVPGEGTYRVDPKTGKVTFTPEPTFVGQVQSPVTVILTTPKGTEKETLYTPRVTPIETKDSTSEGVKGEKQNSAPGTEMFPNGPANPTFSLEGANPEGKLVVDGVGEYTIDPATGVVTFTPNADYVGTPKPVVVKATGDNNTVAFANYTPTVTEKPADPANPDNPGDKPKDEPGVARTTGVKGEVQKSNDKGEGDNGKTPEEMFPGVPVGTKYTLVEEGTNKRGTEIKVEGEGTYTIDPDTGVVTFTPEPNFVGEGKGILIQPTDPAGEVLLNEDGSEKTGKYIPTVTEKPAEKPDNNGGNTGDNGTDNGSANGNGSGADNSGNNGNAGNTGNNGNGNTGDNGTDNGTDNGSGADNSGNNGNAGNTGNNDKGKTNVVTPKAPVKNPALAATGSVAGWASVLMVVLGAAGISLLALRRRQTNN